MEKYESREKGAKPFNAEYYLRASTGPFAPYFRNLVPDVNGLEKLDPVRLESGWAADVERIENHYKFDESQRAKAGEELEKAGEWATIWFQDAATTEARNKYYTELGEVQEIERDPSALKNRRIWASSKRKDLDVDRRSLVKDLDAKGQALRDNVSKLATKEQSEASGPYVVSPVVYLYRQALGSTGMGRPYLLPPSNLELINFSTTIGLIVMGACLILGLFTRLASLAGVAFLAQIYFSMPPWPGLPENPMAEGHYMIVSKNLIEMIALLALMCTPTGQWVGLDAVLFGWYRRRRELKAEERARRSRERSRDRTRAAVS